MVRMSVLSLTIHASRLVLAHIREVKHIFLCNISTKRLYSLTLKLEKEGQGMQNVIHLTFSGLSISMALIVERFDW
jgi:hypothetical protein